MISLAIRVSWLMACVGGSMALAQPSAPDGPYPGQQMVRVTATSERQLAQLMDMCTAVWSCHIGVGPVDVQVTKAQLDALRAAGFDPQVLIPDVQALIDAERAQIDASHAEADLNWFGTYRTLAEINQRMTDLVAAYPSMAQSFNIGTSQQGRTIFGIRISGPDQPGNPRSTRPAVLFHGCQHAREWITPMTNMFLADQMLERYSTDSRVRALLDRCEVIVLPVVNPDGYLYTWSSNRLWRKNRRTNSDGTIGVDPNRNWGYQWGGEGASTSPGSDTYRGTGPFSEPETQRLRDFMTSEPRLRAHMDYHSYSQLVMSPWAWTAALPPDNGVFDELDLAIQASIRSVNGLTYNEGPVYTTIYPAAGNALDWSYGVRGVLGMTIELRDTGTFGFVLPANQIVPTGEENLAGALTLCEFASRPLVMGVSGTLPPRVSRGAGTPVSFSVIPGASALVGAPRLVARSGSGGFEASSATTSSGRVYTANLPGADCPGTVRYYFEATAANGLVVRLPADAPSSTFEAIGSGPDFVAFADDMETDRGWVVGATGDAATSGAWQRGVPQQTTAQPGSDNSASGVNCWVTGPLAGTNANSNDVDGGSTTLTSPRFSALAPPYWRVVTTTLSYARWYSNNTGTNPNNDSMLVLISNDDGANWVTLEAVTENLGRWSTKTYPLELILAPTDRMRLRFVASDRSPDSTVECGLDDVLVTVSACPPDLDLNADGNVDQGDVDCLVNVVAGGANPTAIDPDFNQDGNVDQGDISDIINAVAGG